MVKPEFRLNRSLPVEDSYLQKLTHNQKCHSISFLDQSR
jgi:hypothetical protein